MNEALQKIKLVVIPVLDFDCAEVGNGASSSTQELRYLSTVSEVVEGQTISDRCCSILVEPSASVVEQVSFCHQGHQFI